MGQTARELDISTDQDVAQDSPQPAAGKRSSQARREEEVFVAGPRRETLASDVELEKLRRRLPQQADADLSALAPDQDLATIVYVEVSPPGGGHLGDPRTRVVHRPVPSRHLAHGDKVQRLPAAYRRTQGVRHLMAWLDVHEDQIWGTIVQKKNREAVLEAFKILCASYPAEDRIYIILDNASSHTKDAVKAWCRQNNLVLVFTATNASWMNRIECPFDDVRDKVLRGGSPENHLVMACRIFGYLRWRNARKCRERHAPLLKEKKVA